jgi:hypothetical protein
MSKANDLLRQSPAIAITAAILAFAYGSSLEAQGNGCNTGQVCLYQGVIGDCQYRTQGPGNEHCSCMTASAYQDTCFCSSICGS